MPIFKQLKEEKHDLVFYSPWEHNLLECQKVSGIIKILTIYHYYYSSELAINRA